MVTTVTEVLAVSCLGCCIFNACALSAIGAHRKVNTKKSCKKVVKNDLPFAIASECITAIAAIGAVNIKFHGNTLLESAAVQDGA